MKRDVLFGPEKFRVEEILEKIASKRMNLQPDFQRFYIWDTKKEQSFIDSLMRGYAIPPLWLWTRKRNGKTTHDVIDGQQRLTCIKRFVDGQVEFRPDPDARGENLAPIAGAVVGATGSKKKLPEEYQSRIMDYPVPLITVDTDDRGIVIDIFRRLNKSSTTLLPQELRNAFYQGRFKSLVYELTAELQRDEFWGGKIFERDTRDRMGDQQNVSELMVAMLEEGPQNHSDKVDDYYEDYEEKCTKEAAWRSRFERNLKSIKKMLAGTSRFTTNKSDFYSLFLVIDEFWTKYPQSMTDSDLLHAAGAALVRFERDFTEFLEKRKKDPDNFPLMERYRETIVGRQREKEPRVDRGAILSGLLAPVFAREVDPIRAFSEEQRQYIWQRSASKQCCRCKKAVAFEDYEPDHYPDPWAKGGPTSIDNGAVAHKTCNRSAGAKPGKKPKPKA